MTVPKSNNVGCIDRMGAATVFEDDTSKSAFTVCEPVMVTEQVVAVPEHAPDHPPNTEVPVGNAVSVTDVPELKFAAHCGGQLIPAGLLATEPDPGPLMFTNSG